MTPSVKILIRFPKALLDAVKEAAALDKRNVTSYVLVRLKTAVEADLKREIKD